MSPLRTRGRGAGLFKEGGTFSGEEGCCGSTVCVLVACDCVTHRQCRLSPDTQGCEDVFHMKALAPPQLTGPSHLSLHLQLRSPGGGTLSIWSETTWETEAARRKKNTQVLSLRVCVGSAHSLGSFSRDMRLEPSGRWDMDKQKGISRRPHFTSSSSRIHFDNLVGKMSEISGVFFCKWSQKVSKKCWHAVMLRNRCYLFRVCTEAKHRYFIYK